MGMLGVAGRIAKVKNGVAAADVTPNAVNWNNCTTPVTDTNTQTISGISTTITLSVSWSPITPKFNLRYSTDGGTTYSANMTNPQSITVSNGTTLQFKAVWSGLQTVTVTVTNTSDGNAVLDTFIMDNP